MIDIIATGIAVWLLLSLIVVYFAYGFSSVRKQEQKQEQMMRAIRANNPCLFAQFDRARSRIDGELEKLEDR